MQTAVGLDAERGDRIEVVNMRFREPAVDAEDGAGAPMGGLLETLPELVGKVLLFGLAIFMALKLRSSLGEMVGRASAPEGMMPRARARVAAIEDEEEAGAILETDSSVVTLEKNLNEVRDFAGANPQEIADLVQAWVGDADGR